MKNIKNYKSKKLKTSIIYLIFLSVFFNWDTIEELIKLIYK